MTAGAAGGLPLPTAVVTAPAARASGPAWAGVRHVLAVRLDAMGDLLMTTPALRALETSDGGRRLTLLTSPAGAELAPLVPEVDEVIVYEAPWMKAAAPRAGAEYALADALRARRLDAAAIFTVYSQSPLPAALLCHLAGVPRRLAHCHENSYQLLTDWLPDPEPARLVRHEVRRQLDLVAAVGSTTEDERLSLRVPGAARDRAGSLLVDLGLAGRADWLVLHAGGSAESRRYPVESFAAVARRLAHDVGLDVVVTGNAGEEQQVGEIVAAGGKRAHGLAGRLALPELAALLAEAPLLLSSNTGPVHLAAAVGTPVVDVYALTNPQHAPWGVPHRLLFHDVPCRYCYKSACPEGHHGCLRLVSPEEVVRAVCDLHPAGAPRSAGRRAGAGDRTGAARRRRRGAPGGGTTSGRARGGRR